MLKTLKFVQGAVAKKDYVPALTHFHIKGGRILGYNGAIALSTPVGLDFTCFPRAVPFVKAVQTCRDETVQMHMTPNGRLAVKSGSFTAYVECFDEEYPNVEPEGETVQVPEFLEALRALRPFVAVDASRPWARGIMFRGCSAFATNNIIVAEYWIGKQFPIEVNLPEEAVDELLRIGEEPERVQFGGNSATFHFKGHRWLRTQLLTTKWPDVSPILNKDSDPKPLPEGFFSTLADLVPFVDEFQHVFFLEGKLSTTQTEEAQGAHVTMLGLPPGGCYNIKQLLNLEGIAQKVDWTMYPNPCHFFGDKLRGAVIGMRF